MHRHTCSPSNINAELCAFREVSASPCSKQVGSPRRRVPQQRKATGPWLEMKSDVLLICGQFTALTMTTHTHAGMIYGGLRTIENEAVIHVRRACGDQSVPRQVSEGSARLGGAAHLSPSAPRCFFVLFFPKCSCAGWVFFICLFYSPN